MCDNDIKLLKRNKDIIYDSRVVIDAYNLNNKLYIPKLTEIENDYKNTIIKSVVLKSDEESWGDPLESFFIEFNNAVADKLTEFVRSVLWNFDLEYEDDSDLARASFGLYDNKYEEFLIVRNNKFKVFYYSEPICKFESIGIAAEPALVCRRCIYPRAQRK